MSLFDGEPEGPKGTLRTAPLAERMRPRSLAEFSGQEHLVGPGKPLRVRSNATQLGEHRLHDPLGSAGGGQNHAGQDYCRDHPASFIEFSAVMSGIKEIKQVMAAAAQASEMHSRTILFVDEIHRFNKAQQDAFLPYVERGTIRLIGATTENPSFEIISALLSRCRVYVLEPLSDDCIERCCAESFRGQGAWPGRTRADRRRRCAGADCRLLQRRLPQRIQHAGGGGATRARICVRQTLVVPQLLQKHSRHEPHIDKKLATVAVQQRVLMYDKSGEEHYNLISALHKSVRNSDPDAALYWLARMFAAGEDPLYLARRVVRMAVEDIGLAAPEALNLTLSAKEAIDFLGSPEGDLALAEAVVYLCLAPKSNSVYTAYGAVQREVEETRQEPVPLHLRNAPTRLMKELDYGKGYRYAHDEEGRVADMDCLPDSLKGRSYYKPTQEGREKLLAQRMEEIRRIRAGKHGV